MKKEFAVTNNKKPGVLIIKASAGGKTLALIKDETQHLSKDEYRVFQHSLSKFTKYIKVEKLKTEAGKDSGEQPEVPAGNEGSGESNDEPKVTKKKASKKKTSKKKVTKKVRKKKKVD